MNKSCTMILQFSITGKGLDERFEESNPLVEGTLSPQSDMGSGIMVEEKDYDTQIFVMREASLGKNGEHTRSVQKNPDLNFCLGFPCYFSPFGENGKISNFL